MTAPVRTLLLLSIPALAVSAAALPVSGRLQLANGQPVAGPASLHIEQVGGELGPWNTTAAADGSWSFSDPLLFGNLRITGTLAGHTITPLEVFVENGRSDLNITCVTLTPATTLPPVVTASGTTLSGIVAPQTQFRTVFFEWGFTTSYGYFVQAQSVTPSSVNAFPSVVLPSTLVPPGRTVHYRLKVGPGPSAPAPPDAIGGDQSFVQPFTLVPQNQIAGMTGVRDSRVAWADFDGNGRMDFVFAGTMANGLATARVVKLGGAGVTQTIGAFGNPALAVADANRDGMADLLISGAFANQANSGQILKLFSGTAASSGPLQDNSLILQGAGPGDNQLGITGGAAAWLDFNSTGAPGFILCGQRGDQPVADAWLNSGSLFPISAAIPASTRSIVQAAHVDTDGRMDLLVSGINAGSRSLFVLQNKFESGGTFAAIANTGLPALDSGDAAWADTDADGDMDVLLTGQGETGPVTKLFLNDGAGHFTDSGAAFTPLMNSSAAWGDMDADGDADLIMAGSAGGLANTPVTILYFNEGGHVFTPVSAGLPALRRAGVAWGFWDTDTTLDLLLTGEQASGIPFIGVWANPHTPANTPPSPPPAASLKAGGSIAADQGRLLLEWGRGSDATTPAAALTYNVRVGTSPGAGNIYSGNATADRSHALTPTHGLMHNQLRLPTSVLLPGITYFWSVQSVDAGYATSAWVDGTPIRFGFTSSAVTPLSPTSGLFTAIIPPGLGAGEFAFEYVLSSDQNNPVLTGFSPFSASNSQPVTLTQTISGFLPGRVYFATIVLRFGSNTFRAFAGTLRSPVEPVIDSVRLNENGQVVLRFLASPEPAPVVETSSDLDRWLPLTGSVPLGGNMHEFTAPAPAAAGARSFYRVRVGPAPAQ